MEGMKMRRSFQEGKSGIQKHQLIPHANHSFFLIAPVLGTSREWYRNNKCKRCLSAL